MNHTACAAARFYVDLTPPTCYKPIGKLVVACQSNRHIVRLWFTDQATCVTDFVAGFPAPPIFSTRAGIGAEWECYDDETLVTHTVWMVSAE